MKKLFSTLALVMCLVSMSFAQMVDPIRWTSEMKQDGNNVEITLKATIDAGWHLYALELPEGGPMATDIAFGRVEGAELVGELQAVSDLVVKFEEMFGLELSWYENEAIFVQKAKITDENWVISGSVSFMGCNDETCMMGNPFSFAEGPKANEPMLIAEGEVAETAVEEAANDIYTPVIDELKAFGETTNTSDSSMWAIFILGFLGGFIALFTPCVWPIIPMTVSFFLKRSGDKAKGRRDAFTYGAAIIIIYLTLGLLVTGIFGASALNALSTNAIFNIIFFLMLVVFAVSFFGAFEITLPASWTSKMDAKAETTTGFMSIMLMAFTLVLVSFSCTGPIIGTLLVEAAQGSWLGPAIGMFGFSIALALPFTIFAMFPSMLKSMPKSGGWLNSVKVVLGFLELALSLKFLSVADLAYGWGILDRETFLALWIVIFALLGMYLLGKITLPHDDQVERIGVGRMMLALISFAYAIYLVPGLWGAPCRSASAFAPPLTTQDFNLYTNEVHPDTHDYEIAMQMAQTAGKPVLVDFSGFGCVNCRKMEASVWTDPTVATMLKEDFVLVTLMVDDRTPLATPFVVTEGGVRKEFTTVGEKNSYIQRSKFGANAQPFYVALDAEGKPLNKSYAFDENPANFVEFLKATLENYKK
ncbi:MAG: thioredoxin family protein [Paludibacteraceae bacterium]|nr:thioredoxin family protein [Paludibacteraceae bacterium]